MTLNNRSNFPYGILAGTASIAAIVMIQPSAYIALADSPEQIYRNQQINQYAEAITVQINRPPNSVIGQTADGSGFIIKREGNTYTVLTCNHVINPPSGPRPATIRTSDRAEYSITNAISLGSDTPGSNDLAIVTFNSDRNYPVATFRAANQINRGSKMFVAGFPVNNDQGKVGSARDYSFQKGLIVTQQQSQERGGYTMVYAAITIPGMSGGPVLDADGKVIGVHGTGTGTNSIQLESGGTKNHIDLGMEIKQMVSKAIPINNFMAIAQQSRIGGLQVDNSKTTDNPQQRINNPQTGEDWVAKGMSQPTNRTAAIQSYTQAIAIDPTNSIAFYNRGNARYDTGDKQGAIADYNEAIRLNPHNTYAYYNRGVARYYLGDKQGAVGDFTMVLRFDPNDVLAYYSRGTVLRTLRDGRGAFADFDQVVRLLPQLPQGYYNRSLARALFNDREGTMADLNQAIALNPRFTMAYINRALTLRFLGQREAAIQDLNMVLSYDPNHATATYNRGLFRRDLGDVQGAFEDLQKAAGLFQQAGDRTSYQKAVDAIQRLQSSPVTPPPSQPNYGQPAGEMAPEGFYGPI